MIAALLDRLDERPRAGFAAFAAVHAALWTALPSTLYPNLPLDLIEALTYGREWQLGYDKLPPLPWWLVEAVHRLLGFDAAYYALAQAAVVSAFAFVFATARPLVGAAGALIAVLIIDGLHYFGYTAVKFNHDVIQLPFWALAEMVRQRLGIAEEDPAGAAAARLAAGLEEVIPDLGERVYAGLRVGRLLGVAFAGDSGGPLGREELFAGWRLFFERLAAVQPVVLVVEDAQYDAGLLDFLDYLVDWTRDLPVYVLVLARPELGQIRPGFGQGHGRPGGSIRRRTESACAGSPSAPARATTCGASRASPGWSTSTTWMRLRKSSTRRALPKRAERAVGRTWFGPAT